MMDHDLSVHADASAEPVSPSSTPRREVTTRGDTPAADDTAGRIGLRRPLHLLLAVVACLGTLGNLSQDLTKHQPHLLEETSSVESTRFDLLYGKLAKLSQGLTEHQPHLSEETSSVESTRFDLLYGKLTTVWNETFLSASIPVTGREIKNNDTRYWRKITHFFGRGQQRFIIHPTNTDQQGREKESPDTDEITLATHFSVEQLKRLSAFAKFWNGPVSVAVLCKKYDELEILARYLLLGGDDDLWDKTMLHLYYENHGNPKYPHNILRNMAVENSETDYVMMLDGDFIPTKNAHEDLRQMIKEDVDGMWYALRQKALFIPPVFNIINKRSGSGAGHEDLYLPNCREELLKMYTNGTARQWHFKPGHEANDYDRWLRYNATIHNRTYTLDLDQVNPGFEPYFLAYRPGLPKYWEGFRGYGLDKQSHIHELVLAGYHFRVLYEFYVTHRDHPSNKNLKSRKENVIVWKKDFQSYLRRTYQPKSSSYDLKKGGKNRGKERWMRERWILPPSWSTRQSIDAMDTFTLS